MRKVQLGGFAGGHAVVIGASTTGLMAAAAIARHFGEVTVIERDPLPAEPHWRRGAPQSRHVHVLLRGGLNAIDYYLPGFSTEMVERGSRLIDMAGDIAWYHSGGWKLRFTSGVEILSQSKGFLEWNLRRRVQQIPNVKIREACTVKGYIIAAGRVGGVRLDNGTALASDLVVDAAGRGSLTAHWLAAAGFGAPELTELPVDVGYATRIFRPRAFPNSWQALLVHPKHPDTRCAVLLPIEGDRWQVTLVGWRGDHPPDDDAGFLEWTEGLATPDFRAALEGAEPLEPIWKWRFPANLRRHYDRMTGMPDGLVVIGDAAVSINPIYAQGMSHGAIGASILDQCLFEQCGGASRADVRGLTHLFQVRYAKLIDECWLMSTAEDYGAAEIKGSRALLSKVLGWYVGRINELTWTNRLAAQRFIDVMHFQKPPNALLNPKLLFQALMR